MNLRNWRNSRLKEVLQSELHDTRFLRRRDLTKCVAVERCDWVIQAETVRKVERFHSKLYLLTFIELERTRQRDIELPRARSGDCTQPRVSECAAIRQRKCFRIQIISGSLVAVRIVQHLTHMLRRHSIQRDVSRGAHR